MATKKMDLNRARLHALEARVKARVIESRILNRAALVGFSPASHAGNHQRIEGMAIKPVAKDVTINPVMMYRLFKNREETRAMLAPLRGKALKGESPFDCATRLGFFNMVIC